MEATSLTILTGSMESETLTVTRTPGTTDPVTVDIGTSLPGIPADKDANRNLLHQGYTLVKSADLPLSVGTPSLIAGRTPQVQEAILAAAGVDSPADVTAVHLTDITLSGSFGGKGITALQVDDFDGLYLLETHLPVLQ